MFDLLVTELWKLKRSFFAWLLPLTAVMTAGLEVSALFYQQAQHPQNLLNWDWLIATNFQYVSMLISPVLFSLCTGYLIAKEFQEKTINILFTYSIPRMQILLAKHLVMVPVIVCIMVLNLGLTLAAGLLVHHPPLTGGMMAAYGQAFAWMTVMALAFVPVHATAAILTRSYLPNLILGILALVCGVVVSNAKPLALLFPWTVPVTVLSRWMPSNPKHVTAGEVWTGAATLAVTFLVPLLFNLFSYKRMDVDGQ